MIRTIAHQLPGDTAGFDAQILLKHITGHNRAWLLSHPEAILTDQQEKDLEDAILKLRSGLPLPYLLGNWEFFGLEFQITPDVLIPRPETELLVETALTQVRSQPRLNYQILDIGTGSGIIPISLATLIPNAFFVATDISPAAIKLARLNAERHGVNNRIDFEETDLLPDDFETKNFDIICANLPYIPTSTLTTLEVYGKEPTLALDGGEDGLELIRKLINRLSRSNLTECLILLEIEQRQGTAVTALAQEAFPQANCRVLRDLAGFNRLLVINIR